MPRAPPADADYARRAAAVIIFTSTFCDAGYADAAFAAPERCDLSSSRREG